MGCFSLAFFIMASKLHGLYGGLPNKHSYVIIPQDHKSALASYFKPNKTSGAIYEGDRSLSNFFVNHEFLNFYTFGDKVRTMKVF